MSRVTNLPRLFGGSWLALAAVATISPLMGVSAPREREVRSPRERLSFNAGWRFQRDDPPDAQGKLDYPKLRDWLLPTGAAFTKDPAAQPKRPAGDPGADVSYARSDFDDGAWRQVDLPHDWAIEGPFKQEYPGETGKLPYWGVGWYRKRFALPAADRGKQVYLDVDGAMSHASAWLNGRFVGGWPYGYSSFRLDLTPYVRAGGENVLAVRLDNPDDSSRWYPGGGIYRNVWLVKTAPVHVGHWGTYVTTPVVTPDSATVDAQVTVDNDTATAADVTVRTQLYDGAALVASGKPERASVAPGKSAVAASRIPVRNPKLWDLTSPHLLRAVTTVEQGGKEVDRYETPFGIRTVRFTADRGFLLNGKREPLNGVCNHHDLGALGAAFNLRAAERQLEIMKEMGVNALRTSHNPPAPELLDLCDRMGILVMDESFDCWKAGKKKNDYHLLWDDWHEKDLRALCRRDRNHPSVILWSIGNEVVELRRPEGQTIAAELTAIANSEDPTRLTTAGSNAGNTGVNGFQKQVGIYGQNYNLGTYAPFRAANPDRPMLGSETSSCVSSRGEYFFPVTNNKGDGRGRFQMSSYDLYAPPWACAPDDEFRALDANPHVLGEFVWTGFDYLGEPTPFNADLTNLLNFADAEEKARVEKELKELGRLKSPSRSSYFGIVDLCGFKKDRFYLYQARWRPDLPMAHLLPHWTWPGREGQVTPVHVYTSGDEAELFLNGASLGRKKKGQFEYRLRWDDVKYAPGELKVVAYKGGKRWAKDAVRTAGAAARLALEADRAAIRADGQDLAFVTVRVLDRDGRLVPRAANRVRFEVSGPAEVAATDNGDATSLEPFRSPERNAFNGMALAILRGKPGEGGKITLRARSEGLQGAEVTLKNVR